MDFDSESVSSPIVAFESPIIPPLSSVITNCNYQHDMFDPCFMHPSYNPSVMLVSLPQTIV